MTISFSSSSASSCSGSRSSSRQDVEEGLAAHGSLLQKKVTEMVAFVLLEDSWANALGQSFVYFCSFSDFFYFSVFFSTCCLFIFRILSIFDLIKMLFFLTNVKKKCPGRCPMAQAIGDVCELEPSLADLQWVFGSACRYTAAAFCKNVAPGHWLV